MKHEAVAVSRTGLNLAPPDCGIDMISTRRRSATCGDLNQCHVLAVCVVNTDVALIRAGIFCHSARVHQPTQLSHC
jgi:hypothetical protein